VDESTLNDKVRTTHKSLFDGSLQGIERTDCPAFSFQGHPEASPGPHEVKSLFGKFVGLINERLNTQTAAKDTARRVAER
jgi:carbamoyl-phosphate synthase small subunit